MSASSSMTFGSRATLSAEQAKTGRYITADKDHSLASDWSKATNFGDHEAHLRLLSELGSSERFKKRRRIYCYRGRRIEDEIPWWSIMGPPAAASSNERAVQPTGTTGSLLDAAAGSPRLRTTPADTLV